MTPYERGLSDIECRCKRQERHQEYALTMWLYRQWIERQRLIAAIVTR